MDELLDQLNRLSIHQKEISPEIVVQRIFETILQHSNSVCSGFHMKRPKIQDQTWINFPESFCAMNRHASSSIRLILGKIAGCGMIDANGRLKFKDPLRLEKIYEQLIN
jgi:hypothetical protein